MPPRRRITETVDHSQAWAQLGMALKLRCGFEVVQVTPSEKQLRILGRLPQLRMGDWLLTIHHIITHVTDNSPGWTVDISKHYFLRGPKVVFAWRLIFQGPDIVRQVPSIINTINGSPRSNRTEINEMPLIGASADRNAQSPTGKGAGLMGTVAVGPSMKARLSGS